MNDHPMRRARQGLVGAAIALAVVVAGCASTAPTPMTVYITLPPGETPTATPTAEATPSPSPTEEPSPSESPTPSGSPTSPAAGCTGSEAHKAYFVNAAKDLP